MDDVEQRGNPLHFVHDDVVRFEVGVHEVDEPLGARCEALMDFRAQDVNPERIGERLLQKGGLPRAPGPNRKWLAAGGWKNRPRSAISC